MKSTASEPGLSGYLILVTSVMKFNLSNLFLP